MGGVLSATALGTALWWMTPFRPWQAALFSFLITMTGFLGGLVAIASNLINNLPAGLIASTTNAQAHAPQGVVDALLIGSTQRYGTSYLDASRMKSRPSPSRTWSAIFWCASRSH